jgi:hypothetical protein
MVMVHLDLVLVMHMEHPSAKIFKIKKKIENKNE